MRRWEAALATPACSGVTLLCRRVALGDTNICGASWVCAARSALLLYASEWSRAKPGQEKPEEEFQPGLFLAEGGLKSQAGFSPWECESPPCVFPATQLFAAELLPRQALARSRGELCRGHSPRFLLHRGTTGQSGLEMGGRGWRTVSGLGICPTEHS